VLGQKCVHRIDLIRGNVNGLWLHCRIKELVCMELSLCIWNTGNCNPTLGELFSHVACKYAPTFNQPCRHLSNGFTNVIVYGYITWIIVSEFSTTGDLRQYSGNLGKILARGQIDGVRNNIKCLRSTSRQSVKLRRGLIRMRTLLRD
jgi:hypothetical protein